MVGRGVHMPTRLTSQSLLSLSLSRTTPTPQIICPGCHGFGMEAIKLGSGHEIPGVMKAAVLQLLAATCT